MIDQLKDKYRKLQKKHETISEGYRLKVVEYRKIDSSEGSSWKNLADLEDANEQHLSNKRIAQIYGQILEDLENNVFVSYNERVESGEI